MPDATNAALNFFAAAVAIVVVYWKADSVRCLSADRWRFPLPARAEQTHCAEAASEHRAFDKPQAKTFNAGSEFASSIAHL
jgi:hypothetical protein